MGSPRSRADLDFGVLLNLSFRAFKLQLHEHLRQKGYADVGDAYGYVLRTLQGADLNLKQLASALGISPQGALKIVDEMVHRGYLARHEDPTDGRVKRLRATARAEALLREARRFHDGFESRLAKALGVGKLAATRQALTAIVENSAPGAGARWELI